MIIYHYYILSGKYLRHSKDGGDTTANLFIIVISAFLVDIVTLSHTY